MKQISFAFLITLSGCAVVPSGVEINSRVASWHGAPAAELVAVFGEPVAMDRGMWTWQFTAPGMGEARNVNKIPDPWHRDYGSCGPRDSASCTIDRHTSGRHGIGRHTDTAVIPKGSVWAARDCRYVAIVENGTVTKLTTLGVSGHCRYDELPLRSD